LTIYKLIVELTSITFQYVLRYLARCDLLLTQNSDKIRSMRIFLKLIKYPRQVYLY